MIVYALDPGDTRSALVCLHGDKLTGMHFLLNAEMRDFLREAGRPDALEHHEPRLVIEQIASMGMAVGETVFETCFWSGRFAEAWGHDDRLARVPRVLVKRTLCGTHQAKDSNIRTVLLNHYGPGQERAVGTKKAPGPLYGVKKDLWAALAVGLTYQIQKGHVTLGRTEILEEIAGARPLD